MMVEELADNSLPFINGGQPVPGIPHIPIWLSLSIILGVIAITAVLSLLKTRGENPEVEAKEWAVPAPTSRAAANLAAPAARRLAACPNRGPGHCTHGHSVQQ